MKIKKCVYCWLICCSFCFGLFNQNALGQTIIPKSTKTLQMEALALFQPSLFPETIKSVVGMASVITNPKTGEMWAISMSGNPYYNPNNGIAGFVSGSLMNTGTTPWTGVTVTANFEIITMTGCTEIHVARDEKVGNTYVKDNEDYTWLCSPGVYTLTSKPFTMKANTEYKGRAWIVNLPLDKNKANGVYGKITSIRFNFP